MSIAAIELMPGDVAMGLAGDQLKTLLGSCVSVILTDPHRTVGAMCHIVHVGKPNTSNTRNTAFGEPAFKELFARLLSLGINPSLCQAYVFGGGNMFPHLFTKHHVGASNIEWVLDFLAKKNIPVITQSLGGDGYRVVTWTVGPTEPLVKMTSTQQGNSDDR
jgi:chemotaxis protein CheD